MTKTIHTLHRNLFLYVSNSDDVQEKSNMITAFCVDKKHSESYLIKSACGQNFLATF